jgi:hypothetical protein
MKSSNIDRSAQATGLMNHFWLVIFSEKTLRKEAGLRYISHMGDDQPYWYLWHEARAGVYELALRGAQSVDGYDWLAEFVIKYYPVRDETWYEGLSLLEKVCRESEVFQTLPSTGGGCSCHSISNSHEEHRFADIADSTGAPPYVHRAVLPADFFYAGHFYIAFKDSIGSVIRLKTQTSWQVVVTKDHAIKDETGHSIAFFSKGFVDRNYPGYDISHFLYQGIVKSWSLFHQYRIHRQKLWKGEGSRFLSDGQEVRKEPSRHIQRIIAQTELSYGSEEVMAFVPDSDLHEMHLENPGKEV